MRQFYLPLLLCAAVCCWELRRKSEPKAKEHKIRKFIQTGILDSIPKLNRLPPLSKAKSLQVPPKSPFDPCVSSHAVCLNGGTCVNKDGSFLCQCPPTHYGKKCEILADLKKCEGNRCQNGATCVSLPQTVEIMDPELEANYTMRKKDSEPLPLLELRKMMVNVSYECVCRPGFTGPLCDMTEAELDCQQDYCRGRGTANLTGGQCRCDCHSNYLGERCETDNPCREYECYNSGTCRPVVDLKKGTVEAVCDCPKILMITASVSGDQCETLEVSDADINSDSMPCRHSDSMAKWYHSAAGWLARQRFTLPGAQEVETALRDINNGCRDNHGRRCNGTSMLSQQCFNGGQCEARVVSFPAGISLLMPFCKCLNADVGRFCEFERQDECDPTPEEVDAGVTRQSRCTDSEHGTCVAVLSETICHCRSGYVGEMCETWDPCADSPCQNSECIPVPSETVMDQVGEVKQTYRCLCAMGDDANGPDKCIFPATGNCSSPDLCNHGQCLTCEHDEDEEMFQLCTEQQQQEGFRCLCGPGFEMPYCQMLADPCTNNLCKNGAVCVPTTKYNYDCQCTPGTRGTLCEEVINICLSYGQQHCQNGASCYLDPSSLRGFSCDCEDGWYGRDCQFKSGAVDQWKKLFWDEYYNVTLPVLAVLVCVILLVVMYGVSRRRHALRNVYCTYYRDTDEIRCGQVTCVTHVPPNSDLEKEGLSVKLPKGWYRIGKMMTRYDHGWMNLYRRKATGTGYWDFYTNIPERNCVGGFGLHAGENLPGSVTVKDKKCFDRLMYQIERKSTIEFLTFTNAENVFSIVAGSEPASFPTPANILPI